MLLMMLALVSDPLPPEHPFSWLDAGRCPTAGAAEPYLSREVVVDALLNRYPLRVSAANLSGPPQDIPTAIADSTCSDCTGNAAALRNLHGAVDDMLFHRRGRRFELVWVSSQPEPTTTRDRVAAFYDLDRADGYRVRCLSPGQARDPNAPPPARPEWRIDVGATQADLLKSLEDRETASVSLRVDQQADTEIGTVRGVVAATWSPPGGPDQTVWFRGGPYLGYERVTHPSPDKAINNLEVGVRGSWLFYPGATDADAAYGSWLTLSSALLTDDQGDSSAWRVEAAFRPGFGDAIFRSGYGFDRTVVDEASYWVTARWDLNLIADYAEVTDPGEKQALLTRPDFLRWGYDLSGELRLRWRERAPTVGLSAIYQYRDDLNDAGGNADRITARLKYYPSKESRWAFGIEYDRGENVLSLEPMENWLMTLGYRQ